jgi:hypothetical protein
MRLKQLGVTLALAGMLSTQAYAHEAATEAAPLAAAAAQEAPANVLTQDDLVALFGAEEAQKPVQLAVLSEQEMRETEGALWPWVIRGGVMGTIGAAGFAWNAYSNGARGWDLAYAAGRGFVVGAVGGVAARWLGTRGW